MRIALNDDGSLELAADALAARVVTRGPRSARLALVGVRALLLAGDDVRIDVQVGPDCTLELVDVAGTVAYDGRGGPVASWRAEVQLAAGSRFRWAAEPFVVCDGAAVERELRVHLAEDARAALRETLVLGRTGERGGSLRSRTRVDRCGRPVLVEDLDLRDDATRRSPAVLGGMRCVDTISILGSRWEHPDALQLELPGTLVREIHPDAHRSSLDGVWAAVTAGFRPVPRG